MNENEKFSAQDVIDTSPKIPNALPSKPIVWGPGRLNMAVPDRGHLPNCQAIEFETAEDFNKWGQENQTALVYTVFARGHRIVLIHGVLEDANTREEKELASRWADEKLQEYRQKRQEAENEVAKQEAERAKAEDVCRQIGRLCIEKHGAFVEALPGLSKVKGVRKTIADDIIKWAMKLVQNWDPPAGPSHEEAANAELDSLQKIITRYVKEGA